MEEMSQRPEDDWSEEDLCSDEEIATADILHEFIAWLDIYSVHAFLNRKRQDYTLTRSTAGAWVDSQQLECFENFKEKEVKTPKSKRKR